MKKLMYSVGCAIGILCATGMIYAAELLDVAKQSLHPVEVGQPFQTAQEEKAKRRDALVKELAQLKEADKDLLPTLERHTKELKDAIDQNKAELEKNMDDPYATQALAFLSEMYQVLKDHETINALHQGSIAETVEVLEKYLRDPLFGNYKKELSITRAVPLFEDLQNLYQRRAEKELVISQLEEQEQNILTELKNRERTADATIKDYKKKLQERQLPEGVRFGMSPFWLDAHKKSALVQLEDRLYAHKKELNALRLKEIEHKRELVKTKLFVERMQLEIIKDMIRTMKPAIRISEADVAYAREEWTKKQQQFFDTKEAYRQQADTLARELKEKEKALQALALSHSIVLGPEVYEWRFDLPRIPASILLLLEVAALHSDTQRLQKKKELLEAHAALDEIKLHDEELRINVMSSFYKVIARKFSSDDAVAREKHGYDIERARLEASVSAIKQQQTTAQASLAVQKKALEQIERKLKELQTHKNVLFKSFDELQSKANEEAYTRMIGFLHAARAAVQEQIDLLTKLQGLYDDSIMNIEKTRKQVSVILLELDSIAVWHRPEEAISLQGVKNSLFDLKAFFVDLGLYLSYAPFASWWDLLMQSMPGTGYGFLIVMLFFNMLVLFACIGIRRVLPKLVHLLVAHAQARSGLVYSAMMSSALMLHFLALYLLPIAVWFMLKIPIVRIYSLVDPYLVMIFFLASIPYWLYLAHCFLVFCVSFNSMHGYPLWSPSYQGRLVAVFSWILYATVAIYFFKHAFILAHYAKSEVPMILSALLWIIVQTALLFLITKEWVLGLIYGEGQVWVWLHSFVDSYYYVMLAAIIAMIIMIHPHIGFGGLVLYILVRLLWTALLIPVLFWIHKLLKQAASYLFFHIEKTVVRERFTYAKSSYGLFVIVIFLLFAFGGLIFVAHVWGWPEQFAQIKTITDVKEWLKAPILLKDTSSPISILILLELVSFIIAGFFISLLLEHFVLDRIFDVMLVEPGVQNTVSSIMRYLVVLAAIVLGFNAAGLGSFVSVALVALTVSIGWIIKEPIGDFIAYFIILVQRPVKIGDYIKMDDDIVGVVRRITPRSVVVRKKNSTTLILPNSMVINKPLANWNYVRGFVAFEDILIRVQYESDPAKVKALLEKVLEDHPLILKSPKPVIRLENFSDNGFEFMVRGFVSSNYTLDLWDIASDVRLAIVATFRQNEIRLAVPIYMVLDREGNQVYDNPLV